MEFWGAEIKAGATLRVDPGIGRVLHLSQASLGEVKKGNESAYIYVTVDDQKLVLGTLSAANCTHISYDLVFEKEFELSHSGKNSIYFVGYKSELPYELEDFSDSEEDEEEEDEEVPALLENGKVEKKVEQAKPATAKVIASKPESKKVNVVEPKKDQKTEEDDTDDDDDDDESDEDMLDGEDSDEDEDDSDEEDEDDESSEEEETPKKEVQVSKKRPAGSDAKATASDKKAKLVTPQKKGGDTKKGAVHVSTPHPSKGGKTPATGDKGKQTPKSAASVQCKSCSKTFNSEGALDSHSKAKHSVAAK